MTNMIKRLATSFFFFGFSIISLFADDEENLRNFYNSLLPDFQVMSPEASALGKYGNYSTSGFTGVPSISIPLLNLTSGSFSMPVDLAYDASGIKVEQQATYVGLGWNLVMGGTINQIVCGKNDLKEGCIEAISNHELQDVFPGTNYTTNYIKTPSTIVSTVAFPHVPTIGYCMPVDSDRRKYNILRSVSEGFEVPDIFQASFCGHSVSFTINKRGMDIKIIDNDATNYTIELKEKTENYPRVIEITDDCGKKYVFRETPQNSMLDNASYNLSEIRDAAGRCLMKFIYSVAEYDILKPYYETEGKQNEKKAISDYILRLFINRNYPSTLLTRIKTYCPDTIATDREIVTFTYGSREDIKGAKRIERICSKSRVDNSQIHSVDFHYDNFAEYACDYELSNRYNRVYDDVYGRCRLKLTGVTVDGRKYSFGYNEDGNLPARLSVSQDFWGYYNGQNNSNGLCASPEFKYNNNGVLSGIETVGSANRYASESLCKIGTLNRITYPTGGHTKFYYEANHFDDTNGRYYYPSATSISNVKSSKTISCGSGYTGTGYKSTPDSREFDISESTQVEITSSSPYNSEYDPKKNYQFRFSITGTYSGQTVFDKDWHKYNNMQDFKESYTLPKGHYVLTSQVVWAANDLKVGGSIIVVFPPEYKENPYIADSSGKSIGGGLRVKKIESYDEDNKLLEYTDYKYEGGKLLVPTVNKENISLKYLYAPGIDENGIYEIPSTLQCSFFFVSSSPTYPAICSLGSPNVGYSKITKERYGKAGQLISYETEKYNNDGYHVSEDFNLFDVNFNGQNGKLVETATFSAEGVPMLKKQYSFTTFGDNPTIEDIVFFPWARCLNMNPGSSALEVYYKYSLYPKYPKSVLPSIVRETHYANGSPVRTIATSYSYKESNFRPASVKTSSTAGNIRTIYRYPDDSDVSNSNATVLTNTHCISEVVMAKQYRNNTLVGGYRNVYSALSDGLPVVSKNYSIQSNNTEVLELDITSHDAYGNVREYKKKDGTPVSIIWSYNHQHPVLEIVGCTYNELTADAEVSRIISTLERKSDVSIEDMRKWHRQLQSVNTTPRMCTAYIYSPWHTLSYVIMPNGHETRYDYDSAGRLETVSELSADGQNHIPLKQFEYNYINKP